MKKILLIALASVLAGCFDPPEVTDTGILSMTVVKVTIGNKNNSTVDLRDEKGYVYRHQALGCGYEYAERVKVGSKWWVHYEDVRQGDRYYSRLLGVSWICYKSQ